jgi:hypothetical protein
MAGFWEYIRGEGRYVKISVTLINEPTPLKTLVFCETENHINEWMRRLEFARRRHESMSPHRLDLLDFTSKLPISSQLVLAGQVS